MQDTITSLLKGLNYQRTGHSELAEAIYRDVLLLEPAQPNALYLYGLLQLRDGRFATAATMLEQAALQRTDPEVWLNLARARLASNEPVAALEAADQALLLGAPRSEGLYLQGTALNALGQPEEAVFSLSEAALIDPGHASIRLNLGNAHADLDQLDEAESHIRAAITLDPALVEAHASLGFVLTSKGQLTAAAAACQAALSLDPLCPEAHWNLATALLLAGDYERGFSEYEWHQQHRLFRGYWRELPGPTWTGTSLQGQTLLVHAGQGLGDTIQLARYMPELEARGARVILACSRELVPLLSGQAGLSNVVSRSVDLPPYDCWIDQMSLPHRLGSRFDSIPGAAGYLSADPSRQRFWAESLPAARIGIAWAGNPAHLNDRRRSLPFAVACRIARPGMVSLQVGRRAAEAAALGIMDVSSALTDYAETAALVASLDLVITVDTSVAHLAGALGIPVWLMLPAAPDWRWKLGDTDTPWYSSMQLFRQQRPGDWDAVVDDIAARLATRG